MRIAQVAPLIESVPPALYGGTERVVSYLTEELVRRGHAVTLFASADSRTSARLVAITERSLRLTHVEEEWVAWHAIMADRAYEMSAEFDILHFHIDGLHYPLARRYAGPTVTTLHGRLDLPGVQALHRHFSEHPVVSISMDQRRPLPDANWAGSVYHGLPADLYRYTPVAEDYFAFIGRVSPEKRLDRAIEIAIACNTRLRVAAKVDKADARYFEERIRPLLDHPLIEYCGELGDPQKNDFIGKARALLFPIDWPEPFGLVLIEAFACGTPVVAYNRGSVSEVVVHGVTGFLVENQADAIAAASHVGELDRRACREVFEQRFTAEHMARNYIEVYERLISEPMKGSLYARHDQGR
jgi:glycosyltransferase involved in cell wall biosynthesis